MTRKVKLTIERKSLPGYLTVEGIEEGMQYMATNYPSIVKIFDLPEKSHENRTVRALRIGNIGTSSDSCAEVFKGTTAFSILQLPYKV